MPSRVGSFGAAHRDKLSIFSNRFLGAIEIRMKDREIIIKIDHMVKK